MADSPLDDLLSSPTEVGDVLRKQYTDPPPAGETPEDTATAQQGLNRIKAKDLADRGIPSFRDAHGDVAAVTDDTGAPLTNLDDRHGIAYDSKGQPKSINYASETGPPTLSNPFDGIPPVTEKDGQQYQKVSGLPWQWTGEDPAVAAQAARADNDKVMSKQAALLGRKLTLDEYDAKQTQKVHDQLRDQLVQSVPSLADPKMEGADQAAVLKGVDDHFNQLYASPEANATAGWFGGGLSPEAAALRQGLDAKKAQTYGAVQDLFSAKDRLNQLGDTITNTRQAERDRVETMLAHTQGQDGPLDHPQVQEQLQADPVATVKQAVESSAIPDIAKPASVAASNDAQDAFQKADQLKDSNPTLAQQFKAAGEGILQGLTRGVGELLRSPMAKGEMGGGVINPLNWGPMLLNAGEKAATGVSGNDLPEWAGKKLENLSTTQVDDNLKDTVGAKVGNFVGGIAPYVAAAYATKGRSIAQPLMASLFYSSGYQSTYEDAKAHGADEGVADAAATASGAVNALLSFPLKSVGKAFQAVFGDTTPQVIKDTIEAAYKAGPDKLAEVMTAVKRAVASGEKPILDGVAQDVRAQTVAAIQNIITEIKKPIGNRILDTAKSAAGHAILGAGVQTASDLIRKTYNPDQGAFEGVPEQAIGFGVLGAMSKGFEEVANVRNAKRSLDAIMNSGGPKPGQPGIGTGAPPPEPPAPAPGGAPTEKPVTGKVVEPTKAPDKTATPEPPKPTTEGGVATAEAEPASPGTQGDNNIGRTAYGETIIAPESGQLPKPQTKGAGIVSTAIQEGNTGDVFVGDKWNEPHDGIVARHNLDEGGDFEKGFLVQDAKGAQHFASRQEAVVIAQQAGQVRPDTGSTPKELALNGLKSEHLQSPVDVAAHEAATSPQNDLTEPTQPQKEAGNYQKGHETISGLDISIENAAGSRRQPEFQPLQSHYGYIKGTVGADKDHVDIFVKQGTPKNWSGPVYVVDQHNQAGDFDEHKAVIGVNTHAEAAKEYQSNYEPGWNAAKHVHAFANVAEFKAWLDSGDKGPLAPSSDVSPDVAKVSKLVAGHMAGHAEELGQLGHSVTPKVGKTVSGSGLEAVPDASKAGATITVDPEALAKQTKGMADRPLSRYIKRAIDEEVKHVRVLQAEKRGYIQTKDIESFGAEKDELDAFLAKERGKWWDEASDWNKGHEKIRLLLQEGQPTETAANYWGKLSDKAREILRGILKFLKELPGKLSESRKAMIEAIQKMPGVDETDEPEPKGAPLRQNNDALLANLKAKLAEQEKTGVVDDRLLTQIAQLEKPATKIERPEPDIRKQKPLTQTAKRQELANKLMTVMLGLKDRNLLKATDEAVLRTLLRSDDGRPPLPGQLEQAARKIISLGGTIPDEKEATQGTGTQNEGAADAGKPTTATTDKPDGTATATGGPDTATTEKPGAGEPVEGAKAASTLDQATQDELKDTFKGLFAAPVKSAGLTPKERVIVNQLAKGKSIDQIAREYVVNHKQVEAAWDKAVGAFPPLGAAPVPMLSKLEAEIAKAKEPSEISGKTSGVLFHGTTSDRNIEKFNLDRANWGVGSNPFSQGDGGVYLTNDVQAARYFSRKAGEFDALMNKGKREGKDAQQVNDSAWNALFGEKDGNVLAVELSPDAKIKTLDHYPTKEDAAAFRKEGFDAIRFPEKGLDHVEDYPSKRLGQSAFGSQTTFVLDPSKIRVLRNITQSVSKQALSAAPVAMEQRGVPPDKIAAFAGLAVKLVGQGVNTPEKLAHEIDTVLGPKARPFSQVLWDYIASVDPKLRSAPDWASIYGARAKKDEPKSEKAPAKTPAAKIADQVARKVLSKTPFDWRWLFEVADEANGGTQAQGKYTPKDAYDAMELGVNEAILHSTGLIDAMRTGPVEAVHFLKEMVQRLPTQTKRTAEQDEFQQFSTPPFLAYAANWVANLVASDHYFEPSAGIGGLAVFAKVAGVKHIAVNELSERRLELLKQMGFDVAYNENAEHLNAVLPESERPTVVVMNPPFSSTGGRVEGERDTMNGAKHVMTALQRLEPGGRLVAIVGQGMAEGTPTFTKWWNDVKAKYNVRANVGIEGKEYAKYGTTFGNQLLVIDKTGPTTEAVVVGKVDKVEDLFDLLKKVRDERPRQAREDAEGSDTAPGKSGGGKTSGASGGGTRPGPATDAPTGGVGSQGGVTDGTAAGESGAIDDGKRPDDTITGTDTGGGSGKQPGRPTATDGSGGRGLSDSGEAAPEPLSPSVDVDQATIERADAVKNALGDDTDEVFSNYTPQKIKIAGAAPHPTPLVESSSMRAIAPPNPVYQPKLDKKLLESGALSLPQFEAVLYAGQAGSEMLESGERGGFFIGDGTGVGKGREASAIILDSFNHGQNKAMWISESKGLIKNAKGDFSDLGYDDVVIDDLGKTKSKTGKVELKKGVLFSTYSTLIGDFGSTGVSPQWQKGAVVRFANPATDAEQGDFVVQKAKTDKTGSVYVTLKKDDTTWEKLTSTLISVKPAAVTVKSRLDQVVEWAGPDFGGTIILDEAHNAKNAITIKGTRGVQEPSQTGLAVVELQKRLPNARIVYASATGATEVFNLAYADRLGLWGAGAPFATKQDFFNQISAAGLSAMEIVARDLKALGRYISRTLSFGPADPSNPEDKGVEVEVLEHPLTPEQIGIYNQVAVQWQAVYAQMMQYLESTGAKLNSLAKRNIRGSFFSSEQRFFNQLLTAMQTPTLLADMKKRLDEGGSILLQLTNTNEAIQDRALARAQASETPLEELDMSPKDILDSYVADYFPVQLYEKYTDENGNVRSRPVMDSTGKPVLDPEAVAARDALRKQIESLPVPENPLEQILNVFGADNVAEITGRSQRVVQREVDGKKKMVVEKRSDAQRTLETKDFENGKRPILAFSQKGGTGYSYHSDKRFKNQKRRFHYLVQAGWRADKAIQGLGRGHRSGQRIPPMLVLLRTNIEGHKRFISTIARRLAQLGALTTGERRGAQRGLFSEADNLENQYAEHGLESLIRASFGGHEPALPWDWLVERLGFDNMINAAGQLNTGSLPDVPQFLNRLLMLEFDDQNKVFNAFYSRMTAGIERAKENGFYDPGLQTLHTPKDGHNFIVSDEEVYRHPNVDQPTRLVQIEQTYPTRFRPFEKAVEQTKDEKGVKWVVNNRSRKPYLIYDSRVNETSESGTVLKKKVRLGIKSGTYDYVDSAKIDTSPSPQPIKVGDTIKLATGEWEIVSVPKSKNDYNARVMVKKAGADDAPENLAKAAAPNAYSSNYTTQYNDLMGLATPTETKPAYYIEGVNEEAQYVPKGGNYTEVPKAEMAKMWDAAIAGSDKMEHDSHHFVVGLMLPIWNRLQIPHTHVYRVPIKGGDSFLGVRIPDKSVAGVKARLGAGIGLTSSDLLTRLLAGAEVVLANGWKIMRRRVSGQNRVEVDGPGNKDRANFESYVGGFTERVSWDTRYFIPTDAVAGAAALEKLTKNAPVVDITGGEPLGAAPTKIIRDLYNEDLAPLMHQVGAGFKEAAEMVVNTLSPTTGVAPKAVDAAMKFLGERNQEAYVTDRMLEVSEKAFDRMTQGEQVAFIDRFKTGEEQPSPELQQIASMMAQIDTESWIAARNGYALLGYKDDEIPLSWLDNHYRVVWKKIPDSGDGDARGDKPMGIKRPLRGSQGMLKQHTLEDLSEGLARGGIPYSYNPVTMFKVAQADLWKLTTALKMWAWGKDNGFVKFTRGKFPKLPDGMSWVDDNISRVYFKSDAGIVEPGRYAVEKGFGRLLNNFLSRDLIRGIKLGRGLMWVKNATTALELSLSIFHGVFETLETVGSSIGLGLSKLANRGIPSALRGEFGPAGEGLMEMIKAPGSPISTALMGSAIKKAAGNPDAFFKTTEGAKLLKIYPRAREMIDALFEGGWKPNEVEADWKNKSIRTFLDAVAAARGGTSGNYIGAALRAFPAANEFMMKPLFDMYIPNLKLGMFFREFDEAMKQNERKLVGGVLTRAALARQVWRFVEDRFGEMNFDTLFWNNTFKTGMQLMFRSVTWKLGSVEAFAGAFGGQGKEFINAVRERRAPELHRNTAWLFGMLLMTAALGIVISKTLGGHDPKNLTDVVFPRIDPKDPKVRVSIPTYFKDAVHLIHSPGNYIVSSMAGWIGRVADLLRNKDYFGVQIRDTDDPATKQALAMGKYLGETMLPFSIRGYKNLSASQESGLRKAMALAGVNPAPRYIGQTAAETEAEDYWKGQRSEAGIRPEQFEAKLEKRALVAKIAHGQEPDIGAAIAKGTIRPADVKTLYKRAGMGQLASMVDHMPLDEAERVYKTSSAAEKAELASIMTRKRANAMKRGRKQFAGF